MMLMIKCFLRRQNLISYKCFRSTKLFLCNGSPTALSLCSTRSLAISQKCFCSSPRFSFEMNNPARTTTVVLENFYVQVANYYKNPSFKLTKKFSKSNNGLWACNIAVNWPIQKEFYAEESKKTEAARVASYLALEWLKSQDKVGEDGRPLLVTELDPFVNLDLDATFINSIKELTNEFNEEINPLFEEIAGRHEEMKICFDDDCVPKNFNICEDELQLRNKILYNKFQEIPPVSPLPIDLLKDEIIDTITKNQVVVIKGHTGSGKTTRVPQIIFNHYIEQNKGTECNIVVTQPRRISATSLASRIAFERDELLGQSIGYHVRFNVNYPNKPGSVVFVSTGILLQRMLIDPDLNGVSHVIVDEAHERDMNIDLLLLLLKELIERNNDIRVIIMSATINPEIFQKYFNNCPLISVPGLMYNVDTFYINDIMTNTYFQNDCYEWDAVDIDDNLILDVVSWIHCNKGPGAILVFLPGWSDISKMQAVLQENQDLLVVVAHSKLKIEQQQLIFHPPSAGKRKVILATNIAESSITIPDVVYVIDSGIVKETGNYNGISGLTNTWVSKAVADQRKGRAGRIKEGECYRLYSKEKYDSFEQYPIAEVMRTPLEKLIVSLKTYRSDRPWNTLCKFPEPPPSNSVAEAVTYLQGINVLDAEENLTMLGKRISTFALHPALSVALVYSVFFNCVDPMLLITSFLNGDATFFDVNVRSSKRRLVLSEYHSTNDNIAVYNFYQEWKKRTDKFISSSNQYGLNNKSMENFERILKLNANYLQTANLIKAEEVVNLETEEENENTLNFIAPIFLASTGKLAVNSKPYFANGKVNHYLTTLEGLKVQISSDSVNFKNPQLSSPFLTFYNMNTTDGFLRVYDTAPVSAIAVLIFCPYIPQIYNSEIPESVTVAYPNIGLQISAKTEAFNALLHLRDLTWRSADFFIHFYNAKSPELELIQDFRKKLRNVLSTLM